MKDLLKRTALVLVLSAVAAGMPGTASAEITFGILPRLSSEVLYGMFKPLAEYLSKETGEKVSIVIPKDFTAFKEAVRTGQVDLAFANPLVYVQLKKVAPISPLALAVESKAGRRFRGIIIARTDSGIGKVQDLKGKKIVFVEKDSAAGYIFQLLHLSNAGLNVKSDFTTLPFAMKHDKVTMAVFNKEADAGGIREDDLEKMKNKVDLSQIKIVAYTDYYPNWPMFVTSKMHKTAAMKIRDALLRIKPEDAETSRILVAAGLTGFTPIGDKDYDQLRKAARVAGVF